MKANTLWAAMAAAVLAGLSLAGAASADVFNMPGTQKSLEFVTVGDPKNAADPETGYGRVTYTYEIGTYEVTAAQYAKFLNSVAATSDTYGLYNTFMATDRAACGIFRTAASTGYIYNVASGHEDFPVNFVSWGNAARFTNWLNNGQPTGVQGPRTTETGAYTLNGAMSEEALIAVTRNAGTTYAIPTEDEWYKAAYYDTSIRGGPGYRYFPTNSQQLPDNPLSNVLSSTGTNNANVLINNHYADPVDLLTPVGTFAGSPGPYGTFDQGGNVWEWNDAVIYGYTRGLRGGSFTDHDGGIAKTVRSNSSPASGPDSAMGFRVVQVAEPGVPAVPLPSAAWAGMILLTGLGLTHLVRRRHCTV